MDNIEKLKTLLNELDSFYTTFHPTTMLQLKYTISNKIINKLILILMELSNNKNDLHKQSITLRYCLETVIISKLSIIEKEYFLKFYYSLNSQHEKKIQTTINRINSEILFLKELNIEYNNEIKDTDKSQILNENILNKYKSKVNDNINIYIKNKDSIKSMLFELEKLVKPFYEKKLKEIRELLKNEILELSKEKWFTEYFDKEHQYTKILKQLEDKRTWKNKSIITGYENEYNLTYESASSLLHFSSFSIFTEHNIDKLEIEENNNLISQYINKIINNLKEFNGTKNFIIMKYNKTQEEE